MELLDIYDRDGKKKGVTVFRGEYIKPDDYILVVHVYIYNENREFLIQRRSRKKKVNSGKWDITGGAVKAGEESLSAVLRETKEEIGLELDPEKLRFAGRSISIKHLVDVYFVETQIDVDSLVLQEEEVSDVKMIPVEQLLESLKITEFQDSNYSAIVVNEINRLWNKTSSN
ncbi:MAG: NUDIX domain-containing protein [Clostridiaceae bacterium]